MNTSISLTRGQTAVVDDEDADLAALKWCAEKPTTAKSFYAVRAIQTEDGKKTTQKLHRVIGARMGIVGDVDHEDHNGLNCTRSNLRPATRSQNVANQGLRADNTSGVKGVNWHKARGKWEARVKVNGKTMNLGYYDDLAVAQAVVETAREQAFGSYACHG